MKYLLKQALVQFICGVSTRRSTTVLVRFIHFQFRFVSFACQLAGLNKNYWMDFEKTCWKDEEWKKGRTQDHKGRLSRAWTVYSVTNTTIIL